MFWIVLWIYSGDKKQYLSTRSKASIRVGLLFGTAGYIKIFRLIIGSLDWKDMGIPLRFYWNWKKKTQNENL